MAWGEPIGLNIDYRVLEDGTKDVNVDATIYAGRPVALNASSEVIPIDGTASGICAAAACVYGLAKANKCSYIDETYGAWGTYGSGRMTVVLQGLVTVRHNQFTKSDGSIATVKTYDDSKTYVPMTKLYVDGAGRITNVGTYTNTELGIVTVPPTATCEEMQILLRPEL